MSYTQEEFSEGYGFDVSVLILIMFFIKCHSRVGGNPENKQNSGFMP